MHNGWVRIEFAQSARRHRIGRARVLQVIAEPTVEITLPSEGDLDERLVFLGDDATGRALEVMAVRTEQSLLVIHQWISDPSGGHDTKRACHDAQDQ